MCVCLCLRDDNDIHWQVCEAHWFMKYCCVFLTFIRRFSKLFHKSYAKSVTKSIVGNDRFSKKKRVNKVRKSPTFIVSVRISFLWLVNTAKATEKSLLFMIFLCFYLFMQFDCSHHLLRDYDSHSTESIFSSYLWVNLRPFPPFSLEKRNDVIINVLEHIDNAQF